MNHFKEFTNAFDGNGSSRIVLNMDKIISIWEMKNENGEMITCLFGEGQTWSVKESFSDVVDPLTGEGWWTKIGLSDLDDSKGNKKSV